MAPIGTKPQPTPTPEGVRAVLFDAVGTLLAPTLSVAEAYHRAAQSRGSLLSVAQIAERFATARGDEEQRDLVEHEGRTDESLERERWRRIVARSLDDVTDVDGALAELWEHFGDPRAWRPIPEAAQAAARLLSAGYVVGWASNFDSRLRRIVAGHPELAAVGPIFVSSELGYRKPHGGFFRAIEQQLRLAPAELLLVGDERANDYDSAIRAGWRACLIPVGETPQRQDGYEALLASLGVAGWQSR